MTGRTLEVSSALKRRLLHLRELCGTPTPPDLDGREVDEVQRALNGLVLGDPLLALLANGDEATRAREIRLQNVVTITRELHAQGGPRGFVGIGRRRNGNGLIGAPLLGLQLHFFDDDNAGQVMPTADWLDELIAHEIESLRDNEGDEKARAFKKVTDADLEGFEPRIVVDETPSRLVTHPKFGPGEVMRSFDGKVEVRFEDGTTRTLLERFVQPVA